MARKRKPTSKVPFLGLGLKKQEEKLLQDILEKKDISGKRVLRMLVRDWMEKEKGCLIVKA
jgi:hypothetical protein